ncbi:hypothetical protein E3P99_01242 [Wallemia hederae]|uniref:Ubiquitin-like domain-containing protein n=1 Tax=Wallemia hederae TaxID=1540922 RepID=A0A4T0FTQ6_9BASI|nr:hypothetical protein E3P99_01242 [Wallemia hederae]
MRRYKLRLILHTDESCLVEYDGTDTSTIIDLKEYLVGNWPAELKARANDSSQIRLIHYGKLLQDNTPLSQFFNASQIVTFHLSLRPPQSSSSKSRSRCCNIL